MKKTVLITGGSGLLAVNWALSIYKDYRVILLLHKREIILPDTEIETYCVELSSLDQLTSTFQKFNPDIVVNTVGVTSVELCEQDKKRADRVNVELAANVASVCHRLKKQLVHISTDHLFSNENPYHKESDEVDLVNHYAKTKYEAELSVADLCPSALIIRTNFYGWGTSYRQSFSDFILNELRNNQRITLYGDIYYTPILIETLVDEVHQLIKKQVSGLFHVVSNERLSKYEFGLKLAEKFHLDMNLIQQGSVKAQIDRVTRPQEMSLSNQKLRKVLQTDLMSIDEQLTRLFEQEDQGLSKQIKTVTPYGKHYLDEDDIEAVVDVLRHGALTQGPKVAEFERVITQYTGAKYAVAVSSGTAALHLACVVADIGSGDEVFTTPNTFVASSNCILYVGARPVFVDIDSENLNLSMDELEQKIIASSNAKAIIPVHFAGYPCDMVRLNQVAKKCDLTVIEDAAHALGATYQDGSRVGNCSYSDMTVFSFHPVKGIASGEGGMITTNNEDLFKKLLQLRSHGICKGNFDRPGIGIAGNDLLKPERAIEKGELKRWFYEMQILGFNYRITDIQSALAISQMKKVDQFLARRKQLVSKYDEAFEKVEFIQTRQSLGRSQSSHHIYVVLIDFDQIQLTRHTFMKKLMAQGVGSQVHYIPVPMQPYYESLGYQLSDYPKTKKYYDQALSIPLYYELTDSEQQNVIDSIVQLIKEYQY